MHFASDGNNWEWKIFFKKNVINLTLPRFQNILMCFLYVVEFYIVPKVFYIVLNKMLVVQICFYFRRRLSNSMSYSHVNSIDVDM